MLHAKADTAVRCLRKHDEWVGEYVSLSSNAERNVREHGSHEVQAIDAFLPAVRWRTSKSEQFLYTPSAKTDSETRDPPPLRPTESLTTVIGSEVRRQTSR